LNDLVQLCTEQGVALHVLKKRSAENYIPDEVFEAWRDDVNVFNDKNRFEAYLRRTKPQRDHFPLKDGLSKEELALATDEGLYSPADAADTPLLERRLFPKRPRLLKRLLDSHVEFFSTSGLTSRDGDSELSGLLEMIAEHL